MIGRRGWGCDLGCNVQGIILCKLMLNARKQFAELALEFVGNRPAFDLLEDLRFTSAMQIEGLYVAG